MLGYDLDLIFLVSSCVSIPVVASGGSGDYMYLCEALSIDGVSVVAVGAMFNFTEKTSFGAKEYLLSKGICP